MRRRCCLALCPPRRSKRGEHDDTERRELEWPVLRSAQDIGCYGRNPHTDDACLLGQHHGPHRDQAGVEWLDDGDLARPDWIDERLNPRN